MKKKKFCRMFIPGEYVYLEFMKPKTHKHRWCKDYNKGRDLTPTQYIGKVMSKNRVVFTHGYSHEKEKYISLAGTYQDPNWFFTHIDTYGKPRLFYMDVYQIWHRMQNDEIRNVRILSKQDYYNEFFIDML